MSPWNTTYQLGTFVDRTWVSCKIATGTRSTPARKASRISQKIQRDRRRTPTASSAMKAISPSRKTFPAHRGQLGGSLSAWS
jgi:hypothetical protein